MLRMLKQALRRNVSGFMAGILISIGGCVFLSCREIQGIGNVAGAVLFSVALLCICIKGYALFTGKVGFLPEKHDRDAVAELLLALLGNTLAVFLFGLCLRYAIPSIGAGAEAVCAAKLTQTLTGTLVRAVMCGILMYLAVSIYRDKKQLVGILFCIPVFILSGFEHSIADMFYFAAAGNLTGRSLLYLVLVVVGNGVGGVLLPLLAMLGRERT